MLRSYKYRIYPNKAQIKAFSNHFGCCRFIYNLALETKIMNYGSGKNLSFFDLCKQATELKKEHQWLNNINAQSLQATLRNLDMAYTRFFKQKKGFPKFKSKHNNRQSFQIPQRVKVDWDNSTITVPKIKDIPIVLSRTFKGQIKTVTISKTPTNKYFTSILVDTNIKSQKKAKIKEATTIGIDLGLNHFIITSEGIKIDNPRYLRNNLQRLKVFQRRLSKKVKGSNNRNKARLRVAIQHEKVTNKRMDFLHKLSTKLICDNQAICVENLSVSNMVKNHKLAQAISDVSWSKFIELLKYKADWQGKNVIEIDRFEPTTKTCNTCGFVNDELTLKDRDWQCNVCGTRHDRDINAALNIKLAGLELLTKTPSGRGEEPVERSALAGAMKQECQKSYQ